MRLIDADDLKESMGKPKDKVEEMINKVICDYIDLAPTIEPDREAFKAGFIKAKLDDPDIIKQFKEQLAKPQLVEFVPFDEELTAEWVIKDYMSGFGTFKRWACGHCDGWRAQAPVKFCANCGAKMLNTADVEMSEGTILGGEK